MTAKELYVARHSLDDLFRVDLFQRGVGIQDRKATGASGKEHFYKVICTPAEAYMYVYKKDLL